MTSNFMRIINEDLIEAYHKFFHNSEYKGQNIALDRILSSETSITYLIDINKAPVSVRETIELFHIPIENHQILTKQTISTKELTRDDQSTVFAISNVRGDCRYNFYNKKFSRSISGYLRRVWYLNNNDQLTTDHLDKLSVDYFTIQSQQVSSYARFNDNKLCSICGEYWTDLFYHQSLARCINKQTRDAVIAQQLKAVDTKQLFEIVAALKRICYQFRVADGVKLKDEPFISQSYRDVCYTDSWLIDNAQLLLKYKVNIADIVELLRHGKDYFGLRNKINELRLQEL